MANANMSDRIPTYAEARASQPPPPPLPSSPVASVEFADEPPAYAVLDAAQTTFMIYGTFIHTPNGPCYQLSSPLDQRGPYFRIRRLSAKEIALAASNAGPISYDRTATLYEVNDPPLLDNEYHIQGKRRSCVPGVLEMKFRTGRGRWEVRHVPKVGSGAKGVQVLSSKRLGRFSSSKLNRKKEREDSEWKNADGKVVATEVLREVDDGGATTVVPTIDLSPDLDQMWREAVISLWAARLWVAFGLEKTDKLGGRYTDPKFARHRGKTAMLSAAGSLGAAT